MRNVDVEVSDLVLDWKGYLNQLCGRDLKVYFHHLDVLNSKGCFHHWYDGLNLM